MLRLTSHIVLNNLNSLRLTSNFILMKPKINFLFHVAALKILMHPNLEEAELGDPLELICIQP